MFSVYFGAPGSGKSTMACKLAREALKKGLKVYSNVEIKGCLELDPRADIGRYDISNGLVLIDECGIEFSNREFRSFTKEQNKWFKLYRHARCDVIIFSQSYEDMDKKLRILADHYYLIERSILPKFIRCRRIVKKISISEADRQIIDAYDFVPFSRRLIFGPRYWKYFDSFIMPAYETKQWNVYGNRPQIADNGLLNYLPPGRNQLRRKFSAIWKKTKGLICKTIDNIKLPIQSISKEE